ncbi:oxidoreductase [Bacillus sp. HMF5848]|uniref:molybdopterin-dependent oxidoreductase n=1 Tax=Bacillus sp. HMF5848 TaxID=2495421 RepID=UPI000F7B2CE2|nr:molybdopterin-dependent oxidoreductase [Bacillus sp. HMF5848]RSK29181.1 oxidoreductase [Bacillus sp. HMF5848]
MVQTYTTSCSLNCWDNCGFTATVENNQVVKVDGDKKHPITQGKICSRGRMLVDRTNSKDRIMTPLKKVNGTFQPISWEQALDEIATKLSSIKSEFGSTAVLHSHDYANGGLLKNLDKRFFNNYGGVTEIIGSVCWGAGIEAQKWDFGNAWSHAPADVLHSKNIVVWGRNVARTNMHFFQYLNEAKRNGSNVIVIDPIFNQTAKIATSYISIKPGMDGLLAVGIMKEMLRLNIQDKEFIETYTLGYEEIVSVLNEWSLENIISMTEVPRETITKLAEVFADKPTSTYLGLGMQRYTNGGNTIRLIDALGAVSGNIGIAGGGVNYANLQVGQSFDVERLVDSHKKQEARTFYMMSQAEEILKAAKPEIKLIFVTCGNPLTQVPNTSLVRQAFESVDCLVVADQFMTDTAKLANYVLPTTTVFEEEDMYYSSMYHHYVNYGPKLVDPPGKAKSDLWIWTELANRLGFGEAFSYTRDDFFNMAWSRLSEKGITVEDVKKANHTALPTDQIPWQDRVFETPSGKFEFVSKLANEKGLDGNANVTLPAESKWNNHELAKKYPFNLLTIHPMRSNHSQHYPLIPGLQSVKIEVSQNIAEKVGLQNGDRARVFNERGSISGVVKLLGISHQNVINIDEGNWAEFGGSVNMLTSHGLSDNKLGSVIYDCLVNIKKL